MIFTPIRQTLLFNDNSTVGSLSHTVPCDQLGTQLDDDDSSIGDFDGNSGTAQKKAKKYLDKGHRIQGIEPLGRKEYEVLDITRKWEIEQCNAFIAYPPGSASVAE